MTPTTYERKKMNEKTSRKDILAKINAEREAQIRLGYDADHDDDHENGELMMAASALIDADGSRWPWDMGTYEKLVMRDNEGRIIAALAMIVAELQRLRRSTSKRVKEVREDAISDTLNELNFVNHVEDLELIDRSVKARLKFLRKTEKKAAKKATKKAAKKKS